MLTFTSVLSQIDSAIWCSSMLTCSLFRCLVLDDNSWRIYLVMVGCRITSTDRVWVVLQAMQIRLVLMEWELNMLLGLH